MTELAGATVYCGSKQLGLLWEQTGTSKLGGSICNLTLHKDLCTGPSMRSTMRRAKCLESRMCMRLVGGAVWRVFGHGCL